jgi:hypothetical protein
MNVTAPVILEQRIVCSIAAALKFNVPANIVLAVAEVEGGRPGLVARNSNGTSDLGSMQFNTAYLESLVRFGIRPEHVQADGCYPFDLAAWRLAGHLTRDTGDLWTRAANYHSRTLVHNVTYRRRLMAAGTRWEKWLDAHFRTRKVTP